MKPHFAAPATLLALLAVPPAPTFAEEEVERFGDATVGDAVAQWSHSSGNLDIVLAGAPAALHALPAIAAAVAGRAPLLYDSGIRHGRDIFAALALGARAVLVGRPYVWDLAANGAMGVAHVIRLLRDELEMSMALCGCATLADIGPECLVPARG